MAVSFLHVADAVRRPAETHLPYFLTVCSALMEATFVCRCAAAVISFTLLIRSSVQTIVRGVWTENALGSLSVLNLHY